MEDEDDYVHKPTNFKKSLQMDEFMKFDDFDDSLYNHDIERKDYLQPFCEGCGLENAHKEKRCQYAHDCAYCLLYEPNNKFKDH